MVPHLTERLVEASNEECMVMAEVVSLLLYYIMNLFSLISRFKGVYPVQGRMILRV
jgi:hypothetical protein